MPAELRTFLPVQARHTETTVPVLRVGTTRLGPKDTSNRDTRRIADACPPLTFRLHPIYILSSQNVADFPEARHLSLVGRLA